MIDIRNYDKVVVKMNTGLAYSWTKLEKHEDKVEMYRKNTFIDLTLGKYLPLDDEWKKFKDLTIDQANRVLEGYANIIELLKCEKGDKVIVKFNEEGGEFFIDIDVKG